jgi:3'(2'), 5'-bisphosphate nucleotidase
MEFKELLFLAIKSSILAGAEIEKVYRTNFQVEYKEDNSPLTLADTLANNVIIENLKDTNIPILSEESQNIEYSERKNWTFFWLVDPLDGTKEFVQRNDEFTVNIALIKNRLPVIGVIYAPELKQLYFAARGIGAYSFSSDEILNSLDEYIAHSKKLPLVESNGQFYVIASRNHLNKETKSFITNLNRSHYSVQLKSVGSSLKFCLIAEGNAHIYPRLAPTMEWDTAAGHAILKFAGGDIYHYETGIELTYNKESLINPWFIAEKK